MATGMRHSNKDMYMCRKLPGTTVGMLCDHCDGRCVVCDSYINSEVLVHICDECSYGPNAAKCIICGNNGTQQAYYCHSCVLLEKDRDGCPRIVTISAQRREMHHKSKKLGVS